MDIEQMERATTGPLLSHGETLESVLYLISRAGRAIDELASDSFPGVPPLLEMERLSALIARLVGLLQDEGRDMEQLRDALAEGGRLVVACILKYNLSVSRQPTTPPLAFPQDDRQLDLLHAGGTA